MADGNYIEVRARLDIGGSIGNIQNDLNKIANKVLLQLHHVEVSQAGANSLQQSLNKIQNSLRLSIGSVSIDQTQTVKQAQQISQNLVSAMNIAPNLGNTKRAFEEIQAVIEALNPGEHAKIFGDLDSLSAFVHKALPGFQEINTSINSWYKGTEEEIERVRAFTAEVRNADGVVEKLSFRLANIGSEDKTPVWKFGNATATDNAIKLQEQLEKQTIKASDASLRLSNNLESVRQKFAEIAQAHNGDANIANYLDNAVKAINALNGADSSNFNKLKINAENAIREYTNYLNKLKTTDAQNIRLQEQLEKQIAKSSNASLKLSNNLEGAKKKLSEVLQNHGNDANITKYLENAVQAINALNKADGSNFDRLKINAENAIRTYTDYLNKLKTADAQAEQSQRKLDAQLVSTQKTLDHNIMILGNLSKNSIFGKNATSPEVVKMQANVDKLRESYQNLKTNTKDSIASPELVGKFKELNVQIVDTIVNSQKLAKTLGDKTTNVVPEVELNNLKTLMNNLKASDVEVDKLKADYGELVGLMIQAQDTGDWSNYLKQLSIFKSKFTEAKSEVRATTAATSDLASMAKSLTSNKMNTFFDKNSNNAQVNALKTEINSLISEWNTLNSEIQTTGKVYPAMATHLEELKAKMQTATTAADTLQKNIKEVANAQRLATQKQSLDTRITSWMQNNTRASQETIVKLKEMQAQIQNADHQTMTNLNNQFRQVTANARAAGEAGMKLGDIIKQKLGKFAGWFSIATVVMRSVNELKNMYREVVELDTALVDLRKTTDGTNAQLEEFYFEANKIGKQLGVTTKEVIQATSSWSRLGYSIKDAQEMAKTSSIFASISPGMDIEQATDGLVSAMKAYKIEASDALDAVASKINAVGNSQAVNNEDIVEFLTRSSSAMAVANNTLDETIALGTAITEVTRDAANAGQVMKTASMRIRGYDEETEELSADVQVLVGDIANLTKTAQHPIGVSIFSDEAKTQYKSTVEIIREISKVWDELTDKQQARVLEALGGKRGGQALAAAIENFSAVEKSLNTMQHSAGNAMQEMSIIEESLEFKLNKLKETGVGVSQNVFSQKEISGIITTLTKLLEVIDNLTKKVGGLGTAFTGLMAYKGLRGVGIFDYFNQGGKSLWGGLTGLFQRGLSEQAVTAGITQSDIQILTQYNNALKMGITDTTALEASLKGASPAAKQMATSIQAGTVQLNDLTTASKAAQIGMNLLNSALNIGVSLAISAVIKGLVELSRAYENAAEKAEKSIAKVKERKEESNQIQELIDKYKELKEAETSDNKQETRKQTLELQKEITNLIASQPDLYSQQVKNINLVNGSLSEQLEILEQINRENSKSVINSAAKAYRDSAEATNKYKYDVKGGQIGGQNVIWLEGESENGVNDINGQKIIDNLLSRQSIGKSNFGVNGNGDSYYNIEFAKNTNWIERLKFIDEALEALEQSPEFDTSQTGLYDQLLKARDDIDKVVGKQVQAAVDYAQLITESTVNQNKDTINSYYDFIEARRKVIDDISNDGTVKMALADGVLSKEDIEKSVNDYMSTLDSLSDYYDEWIRRNTLTSTDAEKAWDAQQKQLQDSIVETYKSAYDGAKKELNKEPTLTLFNSEEYKDKAKEVSQIMTDLENGIKAIDNGDVPEPELFTKLPELAGYAEDTDALRQAMLNLMTETPNDLIDELTKLKDKIDLSAESIKNALDKLSLGGKVNLTNRPVIDTQLLKDAGWDDIEGDIATVYSSTYTNGETGKKAIAINFTPIVVDKNGNYVGVLSPDELDEYAESVIAGTRTDDLHLQIGAEFTGKNAEKEATATAEYIHQLQEYIYSYSSEELTEEENKQKAQVQGFITLLEKMTGKVKELNGALTNVTASDYIKKEEDHVQGIIDKLESEKDAQNDILDSLKEQKEQLEQIISDYEKTVSVIEKYIDKTQIKPLEQQKSDVEEYYNTQIEKLKEENEERDRNIELQEKQDALANARKTKIKVYTESQGWTVQSDVKAIQNAEKELNDLQNEITIDNLEKQRDSEISDIEKQIKAWEDYKDAWKEQVEQITEADEELVASKILGADWHEKIADQDIDVMNNYGAEYVSYNNRLKNQVNVEISNMEKAIKAREKEITEWKDYKEQITDINKTITESNDTYLQNLNQFVIDENSTWEERIKHMERNAEIIAMLNGKANEIPEADAESMLAGSKMWSITKDDSILGLYSSKEEAEADKKNVIQNLVKKQIAPGMPSSVIEIITKRIMESLHIKQYARGGISTKTGLSWLDGTNSGAEVIFNAAQAKQLYDIVANGNFGRMVSENILDGMKALVTSFGNKQSQPTPSSINISFPNATINAKDYDSFKNFMDTYTTDLLLKMQVGL